MAAELSSLELNPVECTIVDDELQGLALLDKACTVLTQKCITGIKANAQRDANMVKNSIGIVTALNLSWATRSRPQSPRNRCKLAVQSMT